MCLALKKVQERQRNEKKQRINLLRTWIWTVMFLGKNTKNIYEYVLLKKIIKGKENFILIILFYLVLKITCLEFVLIFFDVVFFNI